VSGSGEVIYQTPAPEFRLSRIELTEAQPFHAELSGPELLLCVEGQTEVQSPAPTGSPGHDTKAPSLRRGQACFLPAGAGSYQLRGAGRFFRARSGSAS
jgi:mannose-6-phosphate isomerase